MSIPQNLTSQQLQAIRLTNEDPTLGIARLVADDLPAGCSDPQEFLSFLREIVMGLGGGLYDQPRLQEAIEAVANSPLTWYRQSYTLYPLYMERLIIKPFEEDPPGEPLQQTRQGEWLLDAAVLDAASPRFWRNNREAWKKRVEGFLAPGGDEARARGGLSLNVLRIPGDALRSGAVDLRPAVLHALAPDGSACDRGRPAAQAAIANAFWQTYWATGALRAQRGATFPVAFFPVDRSSAFEFAPPFRERYVSLRRRLFGRTSIVAYVLEHLTRAEALLFDRHNNRFCIRPEYSPATEDQPAASDILIAVRELNRTGFVDAYTGGNQPLFSSWKEKETASGQGEPWSYGPDSTGNPPAGVKIKSQGSQEDYLASLRPAPQVPAEDLLRIHRVIPYGGCAYLRQLVHEREILESSGKLQGIDGEILAATNSTFFLNFPEEYSTLHSAMNDPVSILVEAGRTYQIKTLRRATFVLDEEGNASITTRVGNRLNSEALVFEGEGASTTFADGAAKSFRENVFGPLFFGAVIVGDSIVEAFEEVTTQVPANGWVLGDSEAFGGTLDPRKAAEVQLMTGRENPPSLRHAFGVGPLLVQDGQVVPLGKSKEDFHPIRLSGSLSVEKTQNLSRTQLPEELLDCESRGVPPMRFPYDWNNTKAPRTALGVQEDGTVLLVVVDGRADLSHSMGVTLAELAHLMAGLGCNQAMNLDGGGSSVMFVNDPQAKSYKIRPDLADGVVNLPSDMGGVERLLPVPLLVCRRESASSPKRGSFSSEPE